MKLAGLDLVDYGMTRTIIITAISEGLKSSNATFTLTQIQKNEGDDAHQQPTLQHVLSSLDQVPSTRTFSTVEVATSANVSSRAIATAAANNLILMS